MIRVRTFLRSIIVVAALVVTIHTVVDYAVYGRVPTMVPWFVPNVVPACPAS